MDRVARHSDREAYGELWSRHNTALLFYFWHKTGDWSVAEDLRAETFLRVWQARKTWRRKGSFRGWLWTIANHVFIDWLRKQKPWSSLEEEAIASPHPGPSSRTAIADDLRGICRAIWNAFALLTPQERAVIPLTERGMSDKDIASQLGVTVANVKTIRKRAREKLGLPAAVSLIDLLALARRCNPGDDTPPRVAGELGTQLPPED
ncbi:MAG: sigma-70 family RNA polymerase sigma factor [Candidatus Bipolaricaulota bacterium]